jgi:hypothetical protein
MSEELRARVAAEIRRDLAEEAAGGFPLLRRFPDSETACVPGFFAGLSPEERESLLDGLAFSATHEWSFQFREDLTQAFPVLRGLQMRSLKPLYPEYDWYGGRPKKAKLKRAVADALKRAGFARRKRDTPGSEDWMEFSRPEGSFPGYVGLFFDPGFPRQIDYGWRDWLRPALSVHFPPIGPRNIVPAVTDLNYETLWRCAATSNPYCWDVITEANLEETLGVLIEALDRLAALATRINALEAPSA